MALRPETMALIGSALTFIGKYGVPAAQNIMAELANNQEPTMADIEDLDAIIKPTEDYFKKEPA